MFRFQPEPPLDPPETVVIIGIDCGHEVYEGELVFEWQGQEICIDCFIEKVNEMKLEDIADALGVITRRFYVN